MVKQNKELVFRILESYVKEQVNATKVIDALFERVSFLSEKKHIDCGPALSLLKEFVGPFKKKEQGVVSNEEKALRNSIAKASKMTSGLKNVDLSNVDAMKSHISSVVDAVLDVHEKEIELDPVEITPEMKSAIDMVFGMAAYNLNIAKVVINQNLAELMASMPSSRLKAAMMKYREHQMDPHAMLSKMNIPLAKRLGSFFSAGLNQGGEPSHGMGGVKVR